MSVQVGNKERNVNMIGEDDETKQELKGHLSVLQKLGVKTIDVAFSGGGDEGQINEVIYTPELDKSAIINQQKFEDLLYDYLDPAKVGDWVNNEGGFGEIKIDVATGKVTGEISFNFTDCNTEPFKDKL
jgi:hypothetical protein